MSAEKNPVATVDITPTFREATAICIGVIETYAAASKPSFELCKSAEHAKEELLRYADAIDQLKAARGK